MPSVPASLRAYDSPAGGRERLHPALAARPPRRALVIKLGHIGDVLVTTPVFTALKEAFPQVSLTALVNAGTEEMVLHNPAIDQVWMLERQHPSPWHELRFQLGLLSRLRRARFDLSLELSGGDRGAFLSLVAGAPLRVGFAPKRPHLRARAFHLLADARGTDHHVVLTFLRQVRLLGMEPRDTALKLYPGDVARRRVEEIMAAHGLRPGAFVVVHPTSRWMFKCWTPEGNAIVIRHLLERGLQVALTAAPAAREQEFVALVKESLGKAVPVVDLSGRLSLSELAALIERARVFFGVDSAPMHMAAALGTPVVVLFGPSGERMWGPWQVDCEVVVGECVEHPCGRDGCNGSKVSRCLVELDPARVTAAVDRLLARS
jgi:heptosyltransferase-3